MLTTLIIIICSENQNKEINQEQVQRQRHNQQILINLLNQALTIYGMIRINQNYKIINTLNNLYSKEDNRGEDSRLSLYNLHNNSLYNKEDSRLSLYNLPNHSNKEDRGEKQTVQQHSTNCLDWEVTKKKINDEK